MHDLHGGVGGVHALAAGAAGTADFDADFLGLELEVDFLDAVNGATRPKAIPGAEALYTLTVTNSGLGSVNNNVILITDTIPANTELFVNSLGGSPAGPVTFTQGSVSSNLSFAFTSLGSITDDVEFANSGGWGYTPVPNGAGYDPAVTQIRFNPKGKMAAWSGSGGQPSFSLGFKVRIK